MSNDDKEDTTIKSSDEKDKLKKRLMVIKKDSIASFIKIEDEFNKCQADLLIKYKKIVENKSVTDKQQLFNLGILEEAIFDKANKSVRIIIFMYQGKYNNNQEKTELTEDRGRNDRMKLFHELKKKYDDPQQIKNEIVKMFKDSKMHVTKILQEELKDQVKDLNKEIVIYFN